MTTYLTCTIDEIPAGLRWDVPGRNAGQIIEVACAAAEHYASEAGPGDEYQRTTDGNTGRVTYARREDVEPLRWVALDRTRAALAEFPSRTAAEGYSRAWHRSDAVMQRSPGTATRKPPGMGARLGLDLVQPGKYLDAEGRGWTEAEAIIALRRSVRHVQSEAPRICSACDGTGEAKGSLGCESCGGSGEVRP
jgi:hypothetical protein